MLCFVSGKSQELYESVLRAIVRAADDMGVSADPTTVICDFETAAMHAVTAVLGPHVSVHGCFYHLCQSTWRKVRELGLTTCYKDRADVRLFCGMLDALAFQPVDDVNEGMAFLLDNIPQDSDELCALIAYFDGTYVNGTARRIKRPAATGSMSNGLQVCLRRIPPMFPPVTWNVFEATLNNQHHTNNECESWNNGFRQLVGHARPSVWTAIEALQQLQQHCNNAVLAIGPALRCCSLLVASHPPSAFAGKQCATKIVCALCVNVSAREKLRCPSFSVLWRTPFAWINNTFRCQSSKR